MCGIGIGPHQSTDALRDPSPTGSEAQSLHHLLQRCLDSEPRYGHRPPGWPGCKSNSDLIRGVSPEACLALCIDSGSQGYLSYLQMIGVGARVADGRLLGSLQSFQDTVVKLKQIRAPKTFQGAVWSEFA